MQRERTRRKLAGILSADVNGYSRLMGRDEAGTVKTLKAHRRVLTERIQKNGGRVVDSPGDNLLAEFPSVFNAVQSAVDIQKELGKRNARLRGKRRMEFRIGINLGDVITDGSRIYGDGVNIASRLESLAEPGGICISGTVYDQIENKTGLGYEFHGEKRVKNIRQPVRVYKVLASTNACPLKKRRMPAASERASIAVLPFLNLNGDPEQGFFCDSVTEDLITDLSRLPDLFVAARNSVFTYKGKAAKIQDVSAELGVRYVLEGSVRKVGDRVRITSQLVDGITGGHVWAERYERLLDDAFAVQDDVIADIVSELAAKLGVKSPARPPSSAKASRSVHHLADDAGPQPLLLPAPRAKAPKRCLMKKLDWIRSAHWRAQALLWQPKG